MAQIPWKKILEIISFILKQIADGMSENAAIKTAAHKFEMSESAISSIWKKRK